MTSRVSAADAIGQLRSGMTVFVAGATAEPKELLEALARNGECARGVRFITMPLPGINSCDFTALHAEAQASVFFATPDNNASIEQGRCDYIPLQYRGIYSYLEHDLDIDAVLLQMPPPSADGGVSLGISVDFIPAVIAKAGLVIAEFNERQPVPADAAKIPAENIDFAVPCDRPVPTFPLAKVGDAARRIGEHVAALIDDGACIQIGIGAIPEAVLGALTKSNDLGFHSGMITDGVMNLAKAGNINGRAKTLDAGKIVSGATLGSDALIEWAGEAPEFAPRPVSYTHDSGVLRQIDNFVSINSALEVDLFGQVNAEMLKGRQVSGTGGSVDMMRGAALARGGRSIVALNATAAGGKVSRIVSALAPGNAATALRTDIDYVVTEYGARRLRHLSPPARAEALIEIAAPEFRDQLLIGDRHH